MFPNELWKSKISILPNLGGLIIGSGVMGISTFLSSYVQDVFGGSALQVGLSLAMMSIVWPLTSIYGSNLLISLTYRSAILLGALFLLLVNLLLEFLMPSSGLYISRIVAFLVGAGMELCNAIFIVSV